jgi:ketosteroid isomerase-like protein
MHVRTLSPVRTLLVAGALAALAVPLAACGGGSSASAASKDSLQRKADLYDIDQLERNWHGSITNKDIKLMMSLWAPNGTFTVGPGQTLSGKQQIRHFWTVNVFPKAPPWVLDTPAFKIRETVNGDKGTLYFECDHIDLRTHKVIAVTASDMQVARIDGRWLITSDLGSTPTLSA